MKKSLKYFLATLAICVAVLLASGWKGVFRNQDTMLNKLSLLVFNQNHFHLETRNVAKEEITLKWKTEIENREIIVNGVEVGSIDNVKGPNVFLLLYNGRPINLTYQSKVAWWHTNDYYYKIEKSGDSVNCTLNIVGPSSDIKQLPLTGAVEF